MADIDFWTALDEINQQIPQLVPLLGKPGVLPVLIDTVKYGWDPNTRDAALAKTPYYQSTPATARNWDILQATDPATAGVRATQTKQWLDDAMTSTGVTLDNTGGIGSAQWNFYQQAVANNWTQDQIKYNLLASKNQTPGSGQGGDVGQAAATVKGLANQYGLPMSDQRAMQYGTQLSQGAIDQNAIQGDLIQQAKSLYPSLSTQLDQGFTVKQVADPYLQMAQTEVGTDPNTVNLTDQKWLAALNQVDPKTGARTVMPMDQWLQTLRTDPTYGYDSTDKAKNDATQLVSQLAQKFGATA